MKRNFYIGIDPDVHKSGVAFFETETKKMEVSELTFFELFDYLSFVKENHENAKFKVVIDAGWLNKKSNFRQGYVDRKTGERKSFTSSVKEKMASKTGRNEEVGKKIVEMCDYLKITYKLVRPIKSKVTDENFKKITGMQNFWKNGKEKRFSQEIIDAGMLVWGLK